jgi:hypothetical protein
MKTWMNNNWLKLLAIIVVMGALHPFPYVYYQVMNWIVMSASLLNAYQARKQSQNVLAVAFIAIAIGFNPLAPLHLSQNIWRIADVFVAVFFFVSFFLLRFSDDSKSAVRN